MKANDEELFALLRRQLARVQSELTAGGIRRAAGTLLSEALPTAQWIDERGLSFVMPLSDAEPPAIDFAQIVEDKARDLEAAVKQAEKAAALAGATATSSLGHSRSPSAKPGTRYKRSSVRMVVRARTPRPRKRRRSRPPRSRRWLRRGVV